MRRYIAFLDILGFKEFITATPLDQAVARMGYIFSFLPLAECLNKLSEIDGVAHPDFTHKFVHRFSFSDSFVFATKDDSRDSLNSIIVSTAILTRHLFASVLPVRGAIVVGDADFVPHSEHMIGTGIVAAVELEQQQDWFGVALSPEIGNFDSVAARLHPRVQPLVSRYDVPLKDRILAGAAVINWRFNLYSHVGIKALLPPPSDAPAERKHAHTLAFARHLRTTHQVETPHDAFWLSPVIIPRLPVVATPQTIDLLHGDEF